MPKPILRAGPFADASNSFISEGISEDLYPVTCADVASTDWPFRFRRIIEGASGDFNTISEHTTAGTALAHTDGIESGSNRSRVAIRFAYQAAKPFSLIGLTDAAFIRIALGSSGSGPDWSFSYDYNLKVEYRIGSGAPVEVGAKSGSGAFGPGSGGSFDEYLNFGDYEFPASAVPVRVNIEGIMDYTYSPGTLEVVYFDALTAEFLFPGV